MPEKDIEIVKMVVRVVKENGKEFAELVGLDKEGNEYRFQHQVYYAGEYHSVDTDVIRTNKTAA